jgi:hypothetical protein
MYCLYYSLFLVFEYCEHDLGRLLDSMTRPFSVPEVKTLMKQLLEAVSAAGACRYECICTAFIFFLSCLQ